MANSFSQIYIQIIFAVQGRENILQSEWRNDVFRYIARIIEGKKQKSIIVNGVSDHVHLLVGLSPSICVSDLVRDIKNNSSNFINKKQYIHGKFLWQEGYGAFSYSKSQINRVYQYILNQEEHHRKKSFKEEYLNFLNKFEITYNEEYLFDWIK